MVKNLALFLFTLLLAPSAFAGSESLLCSNANLSSLAVEVAQGKFAPESRDFCKVKDADLPKEIQKLLRQVSNLQIKLSAFILETYGIRMKSLTSRPISITLQGGIAPDPWNQHPLSPISP